MLDRSHHEQMDVRDCPSTSECDRYRSNPINPMNREILTVGRCRALYGPQSTPPLLSSNRDNSNPQPHNSNQQPHESEQASKQANQPMHNEATKQQARSIDRSIESPSELVRVAQAPPPLYSSLLLLWSAAAAAASSASSSLHERRSKLRHQLLHRLPSVLTDPGPLPQPQHTRTT